MSRRMQYRVRTAVWGRDAALQRFAKLYEGTWRLDAGTTSVRGANFG
ncbi:MAG: hypothetical protein ABI881_10335 [Betaproteobacteria bacterium]